jgi:WD40 repeat protein
MEEQQQDSTAAAAAAAAATAAATAAAEATAVATNTNVWAPIPADMDFDTSPLPPPCMEAIDAFKRRRALPLSTTTTSASADGSSSSGSKRPPSRAHRRCSPNFLKAVRFAPDGSCLLTASDDAVVRVFELPHHLIYEGLPDPVAAADDGGDEAGGSSKGEWAHCLACDEGESIYDVAWYPLMYVRAWTTQCVVC